MDLESCEDGMGFRDYADDDTALFDSFGGIFNLEYTTLGGAGRVSDVFVDVKKAGHTM
jgi:hypothetical protein